MNAPVDPCGLASVVQCASCFFWRIDTGLVVHSEGKLLRETLDNDRNVTFPYKDSKQRLQELELVLVTWKTMLEITPPPNMASGTARYKAMAITPVSGSFVVS